MIVNVKVNVSREYHQHKKKVNKHCIAKTSAIIPANNKFNHASKSWKVSSRNAIVNNQNDDYLYEGRTTFVIFCFIFFSLMPLRLRIKNALVNN